VRLLSAHRVHELARRLYQLQSFAWFDQVVGNVRTRNLSGAGFELDVLLVLHLLVGKVTPNSGIGRKGQDYDIQLRVRGLEIPTEVKAKDDDTEFSSKTIINTIKNAASQLPKEEKGIVFLRIPSSWVGPELEDKYADALAEATRQTSRVGSVITAVDKMHLNAAGTSGHVTRHYFFFRHAACPEAFWDACLHLKDLLDRDWTYFAPSPPF
jgi:hypothetical protein